MIKVNHFFSEVPRYWELKTSPPQKKLILRKKKKKLL